MKSEGGREVGNKGWRHQHEINATTFNFWFRLEGRIFGKSGVFKRNWKGKGDEEADESVDAEFGGNISLPFLRRLAASASITPLLLFDVQVR